MPYTAIESAHQFRSLMTAMATPGTFHHMEAEAAPGVSPAATSVLLTLVDQDTSVYVPERLASSEFKSWLAFHTGARLCPKAQADFALGSAEELMPLSEFKMGTEEYPDQSCTLIVDGWQALEPVTAKGPGIESQVRINLPVAAEFVAANRYYPLGLDSFFTDGDQLFALPRSTRIEV